MHFSMLALSTICHFHDSPARPPLPSLDVVKAALKRNSDQIHQRRVKYVEVVLRGEPTSTFPPLDSPDRIEVERTLATDGRWRERIKEFRSGMMINVSEDAFDGSRTTRLAGTLLPSKEMRYKAFIGADRGSWSRWHSDRLWDQNYLWIGEWSSLSWAPDESGMLLLDFDTRERAFNRTILRLDPNRNYWPTAEHSEGVRGLQGWKTLTRSQIVEFWDRGGTFYPKRTTFWNGDDTRYLTFVNAEFPSAFRDEEFRVNFPDSASVKDEFTGKEYIQGEAEADDHKASTPTKYACFWLVGFGLLALAAAVWHIFRRLSKKTVRVN